MKPIQIAILAFTFLFLSCQKDEVTEVYEYEYVEQYFNNSLVAQIDTLTVNLSVENNHEYSIPNLPPSNGVNHVPRIFALISNAWVAMPCRVYIGQDMNYLMSFRFTSEQTIIYASEPNPTIPNEIENEILVVWLPVQ
jgi:hypothetical protein